MSRINWPSEISQAQREKILMQVKAALAKWNAKEEHTFGADYLFLKEDKAYGTRVEGGRVEKAEVGTITVTISARNLAMMFAEPILAHKTSGRELAEYIKTMKYGLEEHIETLEHLFSQLEEQ
jgi:hypothetical protein